MQDVIKLTLFWGDTRKPVPQFALTWLAAIACVNFSRNDATHTPKDVECKAISLVDLTQDAFLLVSGNVKDMAEKSRAITADTTRLKPNAVTDDKKAIGGLGDFDWHAKEKPKLLAGQPNNWKNEFQKKLTDKAKSGQFP